ncbi:50S ribosomal protein L4 [Candidatus Fermentibacteria bacterium]|nr:50S ribosomal protein L4 [Candidatus Fermentibacteria bacterium]
MTVNVYNQDGGVVGERALDDGVFGVLVDPHILHEAVRVYMTHQRTGTACTKTRGEVSRSNRKPWRQKHTGRARAGTFRSPIWVGGGTTFGPKPRPFNLKMNRQARRQAFRAALSLRAAAGDLVLVDRLSFDKPRTKGMAHALAALGVGDRKTLLVIGDRDLSAIMSGRNIPTLDMALADSLNTYRVLRSEKLVMTVDALERLEQRSAG